MTANDIPEDLSESWQLIHGYSISVRALRRADLDIESAFVEALSPQTRHNRLLGGAVKITREYLEQLTTIDYARDIALAAVVMGEDSETLIGVARYVMDRSAGPTPAESACEFAIVLADAWQGRGIGRHLMLKLIDIARKRGLAQMHGEILSTNHGMLGLAKKLGFRVTRHSEDATVMRATLDLTTS